MPRECDEIFENPKEDAWKAEWFENRYPSILKAAQRALSQSAGDELYMKEGVYEEAVARLCEDLADFSFNDALKLAGRKPFSPWDVGAQIVNDMQNISRIAAQAYAPKGAE